METIVLWKYLENSMHSQMDRKGLQATFYVTNSNISPNLLSRDGCYTLGVIKPCYSVESDSISSKFQEILEAKPIQPTKHLENANVHGECKSHCENEGTVTETEAVSANTAS